MLVSIFLIQVMIGSVDFSTYTDSDGNNEMYKELKDTSDKTDPIHYNISIDKYMIFDNDSKKVCIIWGEY